MSGRMCSPTRENTILPSRRPALGCSVADGRQYDVEPVVRRAGAFYVSPIDRTLMAEAQRALSTLWCCGGAVARPHVGLAALLRLFVLGLMVAHLPLAKGAPVCPHCRGSIAGCAGGDECPLVKGVAANAAAMAASSLTRVPNLAKLLPFDILSVFTRSVVEAVLYPWQWIS